jgi:2',3'-cyclic-nucleotide 2'-phosphodiesterase (5'-nucleotidase family)
MSKITLVHFCDAYHIEESKNDPGAPRVISVLKKMREDGVNPLIVHSGDIFSPSLSASSTLLAVVRFQSSGIVFGLLDSILINTIC